jgi:hypothetical protein
MTDTTPRPQDEPLGMAMIQADELLLEALGRGEPAGTDDETATLLASWRSDLASDMPKVSTVQIANASTAPTAPVSGRGIRPHRQIPTPRRSARASLGARIAVAAAIVGALAGGATVAAANANPGSPLWPITQVMYPARADRVAAENALEQARRAVIDRRFDEAARQLDRAAELISRINDPQLAAQLRAKLQHIRQLLASATTPGSPLPTSSPTPPQPSSSPRGAAHPSPAPGASAGGSGSLTPGPTDSNTAGTSGLPGSSLPSTGLLHSLLPSTLPSLPLPGLGG